MKSQPIEVNSLVTITDAGKADPLHKFVGWECRVLSLEPNDQAKITHPFGLCDKNDPYEHAINLDRLQLLKEVAEKPTKAKGKAGPAPVKAPQNSTTQALKVGDQVKTSNAWFTVKSPAKGGSTTVVTTTADGKERRIWRDKILEVKIK